MASVSRYSNACVSDQVPIGVIPRCCTHKNDRDDGEHHDGPSLADCFLGLVDCLPSLHDTSLLLLQVQQVFDLEMRVSTFKRARTCPEWIFFYEERMGGGGLERGFGDGLTLWAVLSALLFRSSNSSSRSSISTVSSEAWLSNDSRCFARVELSSVQVSPEPWTDFASSFPSADEQLRRDSAAFRRAVSGPPRMWSTCLTKRFRVSFCFFMTCIIMSSSSIMSFISAWSFPSGWMSSNGTWRSAASTCFILDR